MGAQDSARGGRRHSCLITDEDTRSCPSCVLSQSELSPPLWFISHWLSWTHTCVSVTFYNQKNLKWCLSNLWHIPRCEPRVLIRGIEWSLSLSKFQDVMMLLACHSWDKPCETFGFFLAQNALQGDVSKGGAGLPAKQVAAEGQMVPPPPSFLPALLPRFHWQH